MMVKTLFVIGLFSMFNYHTQCCCSGCCGLSPNSAVINKDYNNIVLWFKKRQFDKIREFYNERKKKMCECGLSENNILHKFDDKKGDNGKCNACDKENEDVVYNNPFGKNANYCKKCLITEFNKQLNTETVSVIRYELLKTSVNGMNYYILRLKVISLYVDEAGNLWIRGNGFVNKNEKLSLVKEGNNGNLCFLGLEDYDNVRVYDWTFTRNVLSKENQEDFNIETCTKKNDKMTLYVFLGNSLDIKDPNYCFKFHLGAPNSDKANWIELDYSPSNWFMKVFYSVLYGSVYSQADACGSGCKNICVDGFHYYFDLEQTNHGSMQEVCTEGFLRSDYCDHLNDRFHKVEESFGNSLLSVEGNAIDVFQEVLKLKQSKVQFGLAETID
jgi:hypothetical protein